MRFGELAGYLRRPPDTATVEDLRNFQLHLVDHGTSPITLNATITGLEVLLRRHARSRRVDGEDEAGVCAAHAAGRVEPRGGQLADRRDQEPEASDGPLGRLRRRTSRQRSHRAEGRRRRQHAHDAAHPAGQGRQGSLRHALAGDARAAAHLVASGPCPGQDARRRLAVPGPESGRAPDRPTAQPRRA